MSEEQHYIRVRGRVQGPFSTDQLHSMAKRGQFSRLHEVSSDGNLWRRAAESPDLFPVCTVSVTVSARGASPQVAEDIPLAPPATPVGRAPPTSASPADWYYSRGGAQSGPIDFDTLKMLSTTGQVRPDDVAWTQGMASWAPINQIPGMGAAQPIGPPPTTGAPETGQYRGPEEPRTAGMAIASLVLGTLAAALATCSVALVFFVNPAVSIGGWLTAIFVSILTAILGHSGLKQIRRAPNRVTGGGLAVTGLVMAYVVLAIAAAVALVMFALFVLTLEGVRAAMPS
jgi:hypothetical protein